jgi:excinuclease ABC subunit C
LKTLTLLEKVAHINFIITDTEKEALILEDNLIKEHHPRYNVKLRDDKNYPYLKLSTQEEPTLSIVRRVQKDQSLYFGPYPSATALRETVKVIRRIFPITTSLDTQFTRRLRLRRPGETGSKEFPGKMDPARYREVVRQVRMFLEGRDQSLIRRLREKMEEEAKRMNFEAAAGIRDQIEHIAKDIEKQKIVSREFREQDVVGYFRKKRFLAIYLLFIRGGRFWGERDFLCRTPTFRMKRFWALFSGSIMRKGNSFPNRS